MIHEWTKNKKIITLDRKNLGGSMRLGSYTSILLKGSRASLIYNKKKLMKDTDIVMKSITTIKMILKKVELFYQKCLLMGT